MSEIEIPSRTSEDIYTGIIILLKARIALMAAEQSVYLPGIDSALRITKYNTYYVQPLHSDEVRDLVASFAWRLFITPTGERLSNVRLRPTGTKKNRRKRGRRYRGTAGWILSIQD